MRKKKPVPAKKHRQQKQVAETSWIAYMTGKPRKWWVAEVQRLISKHSRPTKDPHHGQTQTMKAVAELVSTVHKTFPKKGERFDGNMRMAAVLSYVLALWYSRLSRAKSYDPRRPVAHRKAGYAHRLAWAMAMTLALMDESEDAEHFPGQNWESPWDPRTTDGYFI